MQSTSTLRTALQAFTSLPSSFRILSSYTSHRSPSLKGPPFSSQIYILDSSFNPPTQAHLRIATSALLHDEYADSSPKRLLLLLATQNADKASEPASFEHRLTMMNILARDLLQRTKGGNEENIGGEHNRDTEVIIDVGVTKQPYFHDKALAIEQSGSYQSPETGNGPEQVYLMGFDTLTRLLDAKYYPAEHGLSSLDPFFERHRIRVTSRANEVWGGSEDQVSYVSAIADGKREHEGGRREWASRIALVEGRRAGEEMVSSTKAREAARKGDIEALGQLVIDGVMRFIVDNRLYVDGA